MKYFIIFTLLIVQIICVSGCNKSENEKQDTTQPIHLRMIPTVIKFKNIEYKVVTKEIKNVESEIGTTDDKRFIVFKISNVDDISSIAIRVRDKDPIIYYKAVKN